MTGPASPPAPAVRGKFGPALHFTVPATGAPLAPLSADGLSGTCHNCREEFPLTALEEMGRPAGALACKDNAACFGRRAAARRAAAAAGSAS